MCRTLTLLRCTPDKPRAALASSTTATTSIASEVRDLHPTPPELTEIPAGTAPARLDGRRRREGKNSKFLRAMEINVDEGEENVEGAEEHMIMLSHMI